MDIKSQTRFRLALLHPRYWLTWLFFGLWWLSSLLPYRVQMMLGRWLGHLLYYVARRRRYITRRNLELCFPELSPKEREQRVRENFVSSGIAVFETGIAWFWPRWRLDKLYTIEGIEHIQEHLKKGQGMLLLTLHFTTIEILAAAMTSLMDSMAMSYRPHRNPVYDYIQARCRASRNPTAAVIAAGDVRTMVRYLRRGYGMGYLPDQDFGRKNSVFVPFFGVPAATVTGLSRLAKMAKVPVIPLVNYRRSDGKGYVFRVLPAFENYPSGDDEQDARTLNEHVERCIMEYPEQYLWMHRRFKTRPEGEPDLYGLPKRRRRRRRPR